MISVCTCSIGQPEETRQFLEHLQHVNSGYEFEVVLVVDDRIPEVHQSYLDLHKDFDFLRLIFSANSDTIGYLEKWLHYYEDSGIFPYDFIKTVRHNLALYKKGEFLDPNKQFLWLSSSRYYNLAAGFAKGDVLVFTPSDFFYPFSLYELENYLKVRKPNLEFYSSLHALFLDVTNLPADQVSYLQETEVRRYTTEYPSPIETLSLVSNRGDISPLTDTKRVQELVASTSCAGGCTMIKEFHGFHVMSRQIFDRIGGFTEEWFSRAWADDRMTALGKKYNVELPLNYSVIWTKPGTPEKYTPKYLEHGCNPLPPKHLEENIGYFAAPIRMK